MMESVWWIRQIDWRISTGVIFFIQMVIWQREEKQRAWAAKLLASGGALCFTSWCIRFVLEEFCTKRLPMAFGYSIYIMLLTLVYVICYRCCYQVTREEAVFNSIMVLTVYRICWDALKLISTIPVSQDAGWVNGSPFQSLLSYGLYIAISIGCHRFYWHLVKYSITFPKKYIHTLFLVVLSSQMLLEFTYQLLSNNDSREDVLFFLAALLYCLVNYAFLVTSAYLVLQQQENISMQNFLRSKQQYYEISRKGILSLQIKCHDLKHQIARLQSAEGQRQFQEYLNRLRDSIDEYNTVIDSGNKSLDVVLTEKNIICSANQIRFTYIIDGTLFSFLSEMEIYALFGNIMDNALEGMENVAHPEKRFICLKSARHQDMVILVAENYFEHELNFQNGIPVTTKEEEQHHGFGLSSIMSIAQTHGGSAVIQAENGIFRLTISMRMGTKNDR